MNSTRWTILFFGNESLHSLLFWSSFFVSTCSQKKTNNTIKTLKAAFCQKKTKLANVFRTADVSIRTWVSKEDKRFIRRSQTSALGDSDSVCCPLKEGRFSVFENLKTENVTGHSIRSKRFSNDYSVTLSICGKASMSLIKLLKDLFDALTLLQQRISHSLLYMDLSSWRKITRLLSIYKFPYSIKHLEKFFQTLNLIIS